MKTMQTILSHMGHFPQFKNLKQQNCYRKYIKLLSQKQQNAIAFVYIRKKVLHIALKHPGFKMEFQYNKQLFIDLANTFATLDASCPSFAIDEVIVFHSKYYPLEPPKTSTTIPYYHELSTATFTIKSQDSDIKAKFQAIQKVIQCNT
jgi:hypothetical protein